MKCRITIAIFLCLSINLQSQPLDSLKQVLKTTTDDSNHVAILIDIFKIFKSSQPDSALFYLGNAYDFSEEKNYQAGVAQTCFHYGAWYRSKQLPDSALPFYERSIKIWTSLQDTAEICKSLTHIGNMYYDLGQFEKAIRYNEKSLKLAISSKILDKTGMNLFNLGNAYKKIGVTKKALDYYMNAKMVFEYTKDETKLAAIINTIGILYMEWLNYDKAIETYNEALLIEQRKKNYQGIIDLKINIGTTYVKLEQYDNAIKTYNEAKEISKSIGDINKEAYALLHITLAQTDLFKVDEANASLKELKAMEGKVSQKDIYALIYQGIGYASLYQNRCNEAIVALEKSLDIALTHNMTEILQSNYVFLSQAYMCSGNGVKASEFFRKYEKARDDASKRVNDSRVKFETAQQDKEIKLLNKQQEISQKLIEAKEKETKQQRLIIYIFIAGLVIIVLFLVIVINQYRQKKKANILLGEQKKFIEEQKKEIEDSINYALRIQKAVLTLNETSGTLLEKSFVVFHPKSIVSGDFYWAKDVEDTTIITVADCTGHGVPGAFMSMLGVSYLSEIVRKKEVFQANHVLFELRKYIIDALKQQGKIGEQKDGMDIALCAINNKTLECQFAGANNPLYWYKKASNELKEIKGDKMPVAIYERMNEYTNHIIQLEKGDRIYMFSDGYADQFGGMKGKKFMYKSFKELLQQTSHLPVNVQANMLEANLTAWIDHIDKATGHKFEQIDDITVMGIEI